MLNTNSTCNMCSNGSQAADGYNSRTGVVSRLISLRIPVLSTILRSTTAAAALRRSSSFSSSQSSHGGRMSFDTADSSPFSSRPASAEGCSALARNAAPESSPSQGQSTDAGGINWPLVHLSTQLLSSATNAAQQPHMDPAVVRSLHLDATRYMILSMPTTLNAQEVAMVRAAIPKEVLTTDELVRMEISQSAPTKIPSNALRLGVANMTAYLMAMMFFLIPLFMTCINRLLMYERQYQVSERALAYSIKLGKELGERGSEIPSAYLRFREGPLGNALVASGSWLAEGIAGGIFDGIQTAQDYHFQDQMSYDNQMVRIQR